LSAKHWITTEVPRVEHLAKVCLDADAGYARVPRDAW
jgi:hypothetical protein